MDERLMEVFAGVGAFFVVGMILIYSYCGVYWLVTKYNEKRIEWHKKLFIKIFNDEFGKWDILNRIRKLETAFCEEQHNRIKNDVTLAKRILKIEKDKQPSPKDYTFKFEPWELVFNRKPKEDISDVVKEPPCTHCDYWKPERDTEKDKDSAGVTLCHSDKQHSDFSCFKNRKKK